MSESIMGRYHLLDRLGAGGMAEVWLADQTGPRGFRRRCVIKRIHSHLNSQADFVARFEDEARLAAMLRHPNIVRVEDFGEAGGNLFMALEYIDGWDFGDLLRRGTKSDQKIDDALALDVIIQIAEALDYAHALRGTDGQPLRIVHRDVSPQNILLERGTGAAKLLDFGIASAESNLHETQAGLIKGKIAYFSPEQARGDALDGRTDLYALGLVLHEALAGKRVFRGESMVQLLRDVTDAKVPSIYYRRPDLPRALMAAVDRCTSPSRNDRFPDGASLAVALREGLEELGGPPARGALDRWVGQLPSQSELPQTGSTSAVSVATGHPADSDHILTHNQPSNEPAEVTIATMSQEHETMIASEQELAESRAAEEEPDEKTIMADTGQPTQPNPNPLRSGPTELDTRKVEVGPKPFPAMLLASGVIVILAALVIVLLLNRPPPAPSPQASPPAPQPAPVAAKKPEPKATPKVEPGPVAAEVKAAPKAVAPVKASPAPTKGRAAKAVQPRRAPKRAPVPAVKEPTPKPAPVAAVELEKRDLDAVTMRNFQALANCRQGATGITVKMQIHKNGMPFGVRVAGASPEVSSCLRKLVRKWRYPAHSGSAVRHNIKL